ncbi:pirin family protein [Parvibaculaceae bacterium PLY_AMNH_Bact1]|nr:pirin family protein [Parvibaculaceae bacterium PLY_AMNH_Bact1]
MMKIRKAADRGQANLGWLASQHTFSFGHYYDPDHMGFGPLRVINEDQVRPGAGFDTHGHQNMEIITYVLKGRLEHKDSLGTGSVIEAGEVQVMSAGRGIRHSEYNASAEDLVHFLQIWVMPEEEGTTPSYDQKRFFGVGEGPSGLKLVASATGREGSLKIGQDTDLYAGRFLAGEDFIHTAEPGRLLWLQVAEGTLTVAGETLSAGDGLALANEDALSLDIVEDAHLLLFDMVA